MTADDRAEAAQIRAAKENPEGDLEAEAALLPRLLDPGISPQFVYSFEELPSTYVVTCGFDAIRDDGFLYLRRLRRSEKVKVAHKHYSDHRHGFMSLNLSNELQNDLSTYIAARPNFF